MIDGAVGLALRDHTALDMIPPLQSLVKYDNAVLVSSTKEKKSTDKVLKVNSRKCQGKIWPEETEPPCEICSQVASYLGSKKPRCRRQKTS